MTQEEVYAAALRQSAIDSGCAPEDFTSGVPKLVLSRPHPDARRYLELPFSCDLCSYGYNIVASVSPELVEAVGAYIRRYPPEDCFETPRLHVLEEALRPFGQRICHMAEYFLPDVRALRVLDCPLEIRLLEAPDFSNLYLPPWNNALCEKRKELDRLAVGAYDGERLVGLAGTSADCKDMWQIGIDVLPAYRRRGIAEALTSRLAAEILDRGKVPFYCCAWSNVASARNALASGFRPAWVQLTAKSREAVDRANSGGLAIC